MCWGRHQEIADTKHHGRALCLGAPQASLTLQDEDEIKRALGEPLRLDDFALLGNPCRLEPLPAIDVPTASAAVRQMLSASDPSTWESVGSRPRGLGTARTARTRSYHLSVLPGSQHIRPPPAKAITGNEP